MTTLTGGPGDDILHEQLGDGVTAVDGAGGVNTLIADWSTASGDVVANFGGGGGDIGEPSTGASLHMDNIQNLNLTTGSGDDYVSVSSGNDTLNGGAGGDLLSGGSGTNVINGGAGFDLAVSNGGVDTIDGGADLNVWDGFYETSVANLTFDQTGARSYTVSNGTTLQNIDTIYAYGGSGDDTFNLTSLGASAASLAPGGAVSGSGGDNTLNLDLSATSDAITTQTFVDQDPQAFADGFVSDPTSGQTLNYFQFAHLNLTAGSGDDTFAFNVLLGSVNGGGGANTISVDQSAVSDDLIVDYVADPNGFAFGDVRNPATGRVLDFMNMASLNVVTGSGDDAFNVSSFGAGFSFNGGGGANTFTADWSGPGQVDFTLNDAPGAISAFSFPLDAGAPSATLTNIQTLDITTGGGGDHLNGGEGNDTLNGGTGDNVLAGGRGADTLSGSGILFGDGGDDTLTALPDFTKYPPAVLLSGGTGSDTLNGLGINVTPGGPYAQSIAVYADMNGHDGATSAVTVNLNLVGPQNTGGAGVDTLVDVAGVIGTRWNDTLSGGFSLQGGGGDDALSNASLAVYSGALADYSVTTDAAGVTTVKDLRSGSPDGTDSLVNIAQLQFSDQIIDSPAPPNSPPAPGADSLSTAYATAVTASAATLLANDIDPDGDTLNLTAVGGALHGTVSLSAGNVTFTPFVGYVGPAGFIYTVDDGHGGTATGQVAVTVTGASPTYVYRGSITTPETIDFTGDGKSHQVLVGSGDTTVLMGSGGGSARLGAGDDTVIGGVGKDTVTFGPGLGTVTGGGGGNAFVFAEGQIADPTAHGGQYDTITDYVGSSFNFTPGGDFIWFKGFAKTSVVTYEHDLAGDPSAHLYMITDGAHHAEFVLDYAGPGHALHSFGFL